MSLNYVLSSDRTLHMFEISVKHTQLNVERRTSMFPVLDANLWANRRTRQRYKSILLSIMKGAYLMELEYILNSHRPYNTKNW